MADKEKKELVAKKNAKPSKPSDKKVRKSPIRIVKDTINEVKKVTWPSKKDWINHTVIVSIFVALMTVIVGLIDTGLSALFGLLVS